MRRVVLSGYYGFNNAGDEAILSALINNLKEQSKEIEIIVLSANPSWTEEIHQVKAIHRLNFKMITAIFKRSDLLISGGGSLLQDITSRKSIIYYLTIISLAKMIKLPVFFCAQGVGPINYRFNQLLVKKILNKVDLITVRDQESSRLLQKLGVKEEIKITADLVFSLPPIPKKRAERLLKKEGVDLSHKLLAVSVRPWNNNEYLRVLSKLLDQLKEELELDIVLIPLHYPDDLEVSKELESLMEREAIIIERNYNPKQILGMIGVVDMLIGVRLHSLIFAAVTRRLLTGISYDPKIDSFLKQIGLEALGDIERLEVDIIKEKIINKWHNREVLKEVINKKVSILEGLAQQNIELSLRLLGDRSNG